MGLSFLLALTMLFWQAPVLEGKCTWYDIPNGTMRNGKPFVSSASTCAVDVSLFEQYVTKDVIVCTKRRCVPCAVTDSGYLARHGIVLDLSPAVFRSLVGPLGVGVAEVQVWEVK